MEVNTNEGHISFIVSFLLITLCVFLNDVYCFFSFIFKSAKSENQQGAYGWALLGTLQLETKFMWQPLLY